MTSIKTLNGKKKKILPSVPCVLESSPRALSAWSCALPHTGFLAVLSCTATLLPQVCRGRWRSSSAPRLPPSSGAAPLIQKCCFAYFPERLLKQTTKPSLKKNTPPAFLYACIELRRNILPFSFLKGQNWFRTVFLCHQTCTIIFCVLSKFFTKNSK